MSAVFQLLPAVEAALQSDLPVFLGVHATLVGTTTNGESMDELVRALDAHKYHVDAIFLMCSPPEATSATLPKLRAAYRGPIGAYANIGYRVARRTVHFPDAQYHVFETGDNTPERYAEYGRRWLDMGAQIIGGCCGTTPEHIAALRPIVKN